MKYENRGKNLTVKQYSDFFNKNLDKILKRKSTNLIKAWEIANNRKIDSIIQRQELHETFLKVENSLNIN